MPPLPTLGPQPKSRVGPVLTTAALVGLIAGGAYWYRNRPAAPAPANPAVAEAPLAAGPEAPAQVAEQVEEPLVPSPSTGAPRAAAQGLRQVKVTLRGPLETALVEAVGREVGPALAQVVTRSLVWWVSVPQEIVRGDVLDVVYEEREAQEPLVHAVRFASGKTGKTHSAYRYQPPGESYARYFGPDGAELEERLKSSPMDEYEQITSLLRDGRKHKGVDFRAPVGTPVKAPFAGTITRKNWNWRGNGNCLELTSNGGAKKALFLHLDVLPDTVRVGTRFQPGQVIARSGNSGHSFAPHLHYQLMRGEDRVLDPFEEHATFRRSLESSALGGLTAAVEKLDLLMGGAAVAGN